ncbi:hypothetical protein O9992_13125 [Vibrio lentus]|nr:hypothetical protein [Vibrio lentus]
MLEGLKAMDFQVKQRLSGMDSTTAAVNLLVGSCSKQVGTDWSLS